VFYVLSTFVQGVGVCFKFFVLSDFEFCSFNFVLVVLNIINVHVTYWVLIFCHLFLVCLMLLVLVMA